MENPVNHRAIAHNQYSVSRSPRHYMQCQALPEESLLDSILAAAGFLLFCAVMAFMG